jgi:hypothetical protein
MSVMCESGSGLCFSGGGKTGAAVPHARKLGISDVPARGMNVPTMLARAHAASQVRHAPRLAHRPHLLTRGVWWTIRVGFQHPDGAELAAAERASLTARTKSGKLHNATGARKCAHSFNGSRCHEMGSGRLGYQWSWAGRN